MAAAKTASLLLLLPLTFPTDSLMVQEASRSLYFWNLKFHFVFFCFFLSRVFVSFLYLWFEQLWALQRLTKTLPFLFFFFSWRIHQKCDPPTPVQNPVIPGAAAPVKHSQIFLHSGASDWWRRGVQLWSSLPFPGVLSFHVSCPVLAAPLSRPFGPFSVTVCT